MHSGLTFTIDKELILANAQFDPDFLMYLPQLTDHATTTPPLSLPNFVGI